MPLPSSLHCSVAHELMLLPASSSLPKATVMNDTQHSSADLHALYCLYLPHCCACCPLSRVHNSWPCPGKPALPEWTASTCLVEYLPQVAEVVTEAAAKLGPVALQRHALLQALGESLGWPGQIDPVAAR